MNKIRNVVGKIVNYINYIGMAVCFVMVFVVAIDVILRKVSGNTVSIKGSNEFSSYFLIVMCMFSIPMLQVKKGHIWVNMFVDKFTPRFRSYWMGIVLLVETVVVGLFTYGSVQKLQTFLNTPARTDVLNMPKWPFALACLIGFLEFTIILLIDTIQSFIDGAHGGPRLPDKTKA